MSRARGASVVVTVDDVLRRAPASPDQDGLWRGFVEVTFRKTNLSVVYRAVGRTRDALLADLGRAERLALEHLHHNRRERLVRVIIRSTGRTPFGSFAWRPLGVTPPGKSTRLDWRLDHYPVPEQIPW